MYDEVNNIWNGVVLEFFNGRGDVSFDLYISLWRVVVVDFIELYMLFGIWFLVKESESLDNEIVWFFYLWLFIILVWLMFFGFLGFMIIFFLGSW